MQTLVCMPDDTEDVELGDQDVLPHNGQVITVRGKYWRVMQVWYDYDGPAFATIEVQPYEPVGPGGVPLALKPHSSWPDYRDQHKGEAS